MPQSTKEQEKKERKKERKKEKTRQDKRREEKKKQNKTRYVNTWRHIWLHKCLLPLYAYTLIDASATSCIHLHKLIQITRQCQYANKLLQYTPDGSWCTITHIHTQNLRKLISVLLGDTMIIIMNTIYIYIYIHIYIYIYIEREREGERERKRVNKIYIYIYIYIYI